MLGLYQNLQASLDLAVNDAAHWPAVCDEIAKLLGGKATLLNPFQPNFRGSWLAYSKILAPSLEQYISEEWHLNDFRQNVTPILIKRGYATDDDILVSRDRRNGIPFYRDFLFPYSYGFFIGIKIVTPNGIWCASTYFDNDHPPITPEQIQTTKQIRALLEEKIAEADIKAHEQIANFAKFFKGTKSEIYIFDPQGEKCLSVNSEGRIGTQTSAPGFLSQNIMHELNDEIGHICASNPELSLSNSYTLNQDGKRINLLAVQVPPFLRHFHMPFKVCIIATEQNEHSAHTQELLRKNFKLTNSEITTLELLAAGNNTNSIAELLSIKSTSIRQRLKAIYEKTNVNGQIELVSLYNNLK